MLGKRKSGAGWQLMTRRKAKLKKSLEAALAFYCGVSCFAVQAFADNVQSPERPSGSESQAVQPEAPGVEAGTDGSQQQIAESVQLFLPPVLERNKPAWGSVYDAGSGELVSGQKILINQKVFLTNDYGSFDFLVPDSENLNVCVVNSTGKKIWELNYVSSEHGLLISDKSAAKIVDNLDELSSHASNEPVISHAPSVIEPLQTVVILGKNFSGKPGDDEFEIDEQPADLLAASPRSMLAVSHRFMKVGPIKEMHVCRRDLCSLPCEVDISRADLKVEPSAAGKIKLRVNVVGSTLPVAVSVMNDSTKSNIRFGGWRLGRQNVFLSPGGQLNHFVTEMDNNLSESALSAHLVSNGIFDPYSLRAIINLLPRAVSETFEKAEIIRLKKREIGLEMQSAAVRQEREAALKNNKFNAEEQQRLDSSAAAISARLFRVQKMLSSRRAVLEGMGDTDYSKLIDIAASGSTASLENIIATKDLGFTEARLLKVVGRKSEEQKVVQSYMPPYMVQYAAPPPAVLQGYRKKFGKRAYIPPPPATMALVPPPLPYSPSPGDLGPFLSSPESAAKPANNSLTRSAKASPSGSAAIKKIKSKSKTTVESTQKNRKHRNLRVNAGGQSANLPASSPTLRQQRSTSKSPELGQKASPAHLAARG